MSNKMNPTKPSDYFGEQDVKKLAKKMCAELIANYRAAGHLFRDIDKLVTDEDFFKLGFDACANISSQEIKELKEKLVECKKSIKAFLETDINCECGYFEGDTEETGMSICAKCFAELTLDKLTNQRKG